MPEAAPPGAQAAALWRAGKLAGLGLLLVVAGMATVVIGSYSANKPHEVKGEWLVSLILVAQVVLVLLVARALIQAWRARAEGALRAIDTLPLVVAVGYTLLMGGWLLFVGARVVSSWLS